VVAYGIPADGECSSNGAVRMLGGCCPDDAYDGGKEFKSWLSQVGHAADLDIYIEALRTSFDNVGRTMTIYVNGDGDVDTRFFTDIGVESELHKSMFQKLFMSSRGHVEAMGDIADGCTDDGGNGSTGADHDTHNGRDHRSQDVSASVDKECGPNDLVCRKPRRCGAAAAGLACFR